MRLVARALAAKVSREALAASLGISQATVSRLARRINADPAILDETPGEIIEKRAVGVIDDVTMRSLPAAAETAAVVATGLILVNLAAAQRLDLAGLGGVPLDRYWAYSSALAGALLVGCDLVVP